MLISYRSLSISKLSIAGSLFVLNAFLFLYFRHTGLRVSLSITRANPTHHELPVPNKIPERIWYKIGPKGLGEDSKQMIDDCLQKNPTHRSEILTDDLADSYVKENFAFRPEIVETYLALTIPILKADLLRYLLLYLEGGIWNDLDVSCEDTPIKNWIPKDLEDEVNIVVGWEFDIGWGEKIVRQFATWTIMARPRSPHMLMVVDDILDAIHRFAKEHNVAISDLTTAILPDVVDFTGPRRFTRAVFRSLESTLQESIDMKDISNILEPVLVGDALILPGYSFARSVNTYHTNDTGPALVTHHYAGSWKNPHGGEI